MFEQQPAWTLHRFTDVSTDIHVVFVHDCAYEMMNNILASMPDPECTDGQLLYSINGGVPIAPPCGCNRA